MRYKIKIGEQYLITPPNHINSDYTKLCWTKDFNKASSYGEKITAHYKKIWRCYNIELIPIPAP